MKLLKGAFSSKQLSLISIKQRVGVRYEKDQLEKKDKAPGNFNWYVVIIHGGIEFE